MRNVTREVLIAEGLPPALKEDIRIRDHAKKILDHKTNNQSSGAKVNQTTIKLNGVIDQYEGARRSPMIQERCEQRSTFQRVTARDVRPI